MSCLKVADSINKDIDAQGVKLRFYAYRFKITLLILPFKKANKRLKTMEY